MRYRSIGRNPLCLSEIAFGTGDNAGAMVHGSSREQVALVEFALQSGVNLFDTSAAYGKGAAEVNLGRVLRDLDARDVHVITKAFIPPNDFGRIGEKVTESLEDSLFRLRREYVDILLLHNPIRRAINPENPLIRAMTPAQAIDQALPALVRARDAGKCRMLGLACDESEADQVIQVLDTGEFAMINLTYNLANPSAAQRFDRVPTAIDFTGLFAAAERHDAWISVVRPLAGGALAGAVLARGLEGVHSLSRGYFRMLPQVHTPMIEQARRFGFLDRPPHQPIAQAAYQFILQQPRVASVIGGFSESAHLHAPLRAVEAGSLSREDNARIAAIHAEGY